jgi:hypothetical protein
MKQLELPTGVLTSLRLLARWASRFYLIKVPRNFLLPDSA